MKMFYNKSSMAALLLCLLVGTSGCSFVPGKSSAAELLPGWRQETVEIRLPAYPTETHPPLAGWQMRYIQDGEARVERLAATRTSVHLKVDKNLGTPVLFYPLTDVQGKSIQFFRPAGCVYPYNRAASWQDGFTAELFYQLVTSSPGEDVASSHLRQFNWPLLTQQIQKQVKNAQDKGNVFSPWFVQKSPLKEALLQGKASSKSIKRSSPTQISLEGIINGKQTLQAGDGKLNARQDLFYRYIPLGTVSDQLWIPLQDDYTLHEENAFLRGEQTLTLFTKKNQKPALVTTGIERYTERR